MSKLLNLAGQSFGRWTVTGQWQIKPIGKVGKQTRRFWLCECSCGQQNWIATADLVGRRTTSCGCKSRENWIRTLTRHGHARKGLLSGSYKSWSRMWDRTTNRKQDHADRYVKRGITVDPRWKSFETFLADMGERPAGKRLYRINTNLGYSTQNCRWATQSEQNRNTCRTKLTFEAAVEIALRAFCGERRKTIADDFAISTGTLHAIVNGKVWRDAFLKAVSIYRITQGGEGHDVSQ
jgi:hypothetical protein